MATLHVRNVPDHLYELLREQAAARGRSIGAEVMVLMQDALSAGEGRAWPVGTPRRRGATELERFSREARRVIFAAREAARELGSPALGTEHVLLAILDEQVTVAGLALLRAGLDRTSVRERIEAARMAPPSVIVAAQAIPFAPGTKKALELALRESIAMRCSEIDTEHLLLGIAAEADGLAAAILREAGYDAASLRQAVVAPIQHENFAVEVRYGFRVVELTGEAADWEHQLNALASMSLELVAIVDKRAIFKIPVSEP